MPEDYRKQIEDAAEAVRREEGSGQPFSDEDAKQRIEWHLAHNFVESLKGKGTNPVPDSLIKLIGWAYGEYCLQILKDARQEGSQKAASG
jgi:hypothetical protein